MKYFNREEFACKCGCGFDTVDFELAALLDSVREHFNKPIVITSGCRCATHNKAVGGSAKSQHLVGKAVDFIVKEVPEDRVVHYLLTKYPNSYGIGRYNGRTHIDVRDTIARWDKR